MRRLVLAGCGGMGRRHLRAYRTLDELEPGRLELAAVVDPELDRAHFVAAEAQELLGARPAVFTSLDAALDAALGLELIDVVTAAAAHHTIAAQAAAAGLHALCEKPMAPTVQACRVMQAAAQRHGRVLSIAENYRRDPIARLLRALLEAGAIGELRTVVDLAAGGGRSASAGGWQFKRAHGGSLLESGVHNADLQLYLGGPVDRVHGQVRLREPRRFFRGAQVKPFHEHYAAGYPEAEAADAPDSLAAIYEYENGALGHWLYDRAAHGPGFVRFSIFGSEGQIDMPGVRTGRPLRVYLGGAAHPYTDAEVLALAPDFALDDRTARFFGGDRLARYDNAGDGVGGSADLKLIAMEIAELLDAVDGRGPVEVDAEAGLAPVALVMAAHESSHAGRPVTMREVLDGALCAYQDAANRALGLTS